MKKAYVILAAALLGTGCASTAPDHGTHRQKVGPAYAPKVHWHTLVEGRQIASRDAKPMLVDFAVPEHCSRCQFLQDNVYSRDSIVAKINADFVPVWIDLSGELTAEERRLGEEFDYRNDCLLLFLDHRGAVLKDPQGRQLCFAEEIEPEVFIEYLDHVMRTYTPRP